MNLRLLGGVAAVVVLATGATPLAQNPRDLRTPQAPASVAAGKGSIQGVVVSSDLGRPVRRANVAISGGDVRMARTVQTDEQGAFSFTDLPTGEFTLTASKGGFVDSIYGQKQPGSGRPGTPIRLLAGQQLKDVSMPLARGGVITGRVLDEVGDPAYGINVRLYRWVMKSGERTLAPGESAVTDDRGIYRIPALLPGEYVASVNPGVSGGGVFKLAAGLEYVKAMEAIEYEIALSGSATRVGLRLPPSPTGAPKTGFAQSFYPGVTQVGAANSITLGPGEERPNIDFNLQVVPIVQVSGTVTGATGPVSGATVQLIDSSQPAGFGGRTARTGTDGRFTFDSVPPGQYSLMCRAVPKGAPQLEASAREAAMFFAGVEDKERITVARAINAVAQMWASADVSVDGRDVTDLGLLLQPGLTVSGRLAVDTGAALPSNRISVGFAPVGLQIGEQATIGPAALEADGRFSIKGVTPGRYRLVVMGGMPSGFSLASAVFNGQDILDVPIEITGNPNVGEGTVTLTAKTTEVSGHVRAMNGDPAPGVTMIAYPAEERFWVPESRRIMAARPATDGRYQFRNLPPGEYRLIAVSDVEPGRWFDPAFLRQLAGFTTFTMSPGGKHAQDFQVK